MAELIVALDVPRQSTALALARGLQAGKIIKEVLAVIGAKGGGRPDSAMGGTNEPARLGEALAAAPAIVEGMLK